MERRKRERGVKRRREVEFAAGLCDLLRGDFKVKQATPMNPIINHSIIHISNVIIGHLEMYFTKQLISLSANRNTLSNLET